MDSREWSEYYAVTLERGPNPFLDVLAPFLASEGLAYDLGCGVGHGTLFLLDRGYRVLANDAEAEAVEITQSRLALGSDACVIQATFQDLRFEPFDLALALFTLFFMPEEDFRPFWSRLRAASRTGALIAGQFLGVHDEWVGRGYTAHTRDAALADLDGLELLHLDEVERDGETAQGKPKHWHVFHFVARQPRP